MTAYVSRAAGCGGGIRRSAARRRWITGDDIATPPSIPAHHSLPPCSHPSRTLRAAPRPPTAVLDRHSAQQPHQCAGRDGRMAPPGPNQRMSPFNRRTRSALHLPNAVPKSLQRHAPLRHLSACVTAVAARQYRASRRPIRVHLCPSVSICVTRLLVSPRAPRLPRRARLHPRSVSNTPVCPSARRAASTHSPESRRPA